MALEEFSRFFGETKTPYSNGLTNAKLIAARIHEKVQKDSKPPTGNQNCQLCVWCAEAQFRGRTDMPRPIYSPRDPVFSLDGSNIILDGDTYYVNDMKELMKHVDTPGSRWYCHVKWKGGSGGHEFMIVNIDNTILIVDPQQGVAEPITNLKTFNEYFGDIELKWKSFFVRLDDHPLDVKLLEKLNSMDELVPWDPKLDIPYMLKEGMISKEEAEQYWKDHPSEIHEYDEPRPLTFEELYLPKGIGFRPAVEADLDKILEWTLETINEKYRHKPNIADALNKENKENIGTIKIIIDVDNDKDIGMYQAYPIDDGEWWYLADIYLIPGYRGQGIGSSIIKNDIAQHDKIVLRVDPDNKKAINLYRSLGFIITENEENSWIMRLDRSKSKNVFTSGDFSKYADGVDLDKARGPIQESWNDIKNGVNPHSKKLWFHVSRSDKHEGKVFTPRVPGYLTNTKFGKDDPYYEDMKIPRVCFSPSIEGAIHAITSQGDRIGTGGEEMYVYIPEKPIEEYKHITNKEIVDKKLVFDAKYTKECWITEPVKLILYGTIMIDQVYNHRAKPTANKQADVGVVSYKWHWQTKPQVIKSMGHEIFAWDDDKEKQHQKNNKQNNKPIKEEFTVDMFERDPSILKMIMESENDTEKDGDFDFDPGEDDDKGENKVPSEASPDSDDIDEFSMDETNEQNQYDPKEIETLNKLISAEAEAISDYFEASKNTRVPVLSKVYSDIGEEERFHLEQLLYSKSTITGEKYEPRDPKVRKEYEELLELGMDEETAMTTAVDKLSISVSVPDEGPEEPEEDGIDIDIKESFDMIASMSGVTSLAYNTLLDAVIDKTDIRQSMYTEYAQLIEEMFVMEEVDNLNRKEGKVGSPIKTVAKAFSAVYKLAIGLVRKGKVAFTKVRLKDKRRWEWIKKNGIKGLFGEGAKFYFYSDKRNQYEVGQAMTLLQIIYVMNQKIINDCKLQVQTGKYEIESFMKTLANIAKQPSDSAEMVQRILRSNLAEGIKTLQGMVLSKTKIVITEENEAYFEKLFFGYTPEKYKLIETAEDGSQVKIDVSQNIYNQLDLLLNALERIGNETNEVIQALEKLEGQGGVYANNPKLYNLCVQATSVMTKTVNQFIKAVSSDISTSFSLNRGLKEMVDTADTGKGEEKTQAKKDVKEWETQYAKDEGERRKAAAEENAKLAQTKRSIRSV